MKGDAFELLVLHYLTIDPTYATKIKEAWLLEDVPESIRKRLRLPGADEGIDLVVRTVDKEFWSVQCKFRTDPIYTITRTELTTFTDLTFTVCRGFSLALVCTNALVTAKKRLYGERLQCCEGDRFETLDAEFFTNLRRRIGGRKAQLKPRKPRPHQRRAVNRAVTHFQKNRQKRGKLIQPCGTGKSLSSFWIARALKARRVLVAVPSLALLRQSLEMWAQEACARREPIDWIVVCSEECITSQERDAPVQLQELGVKVDTNPRNVARWLSTRGRRPKVLFTTYQSGRATALAARRARFTFDLGIFDESHQMVGKERKVFAHMLRDKNIRIKKRMFMTATEKRYLGSGDEIISMDNAELFGDTIDLLTYKDALERQPAILSDYKIVTAVITRKEIRALVRKNFYVRPTSGQWSKDIESRMLAALVVLRKTLRRTPIKHCVSFHNTVARAENFATNQAHFTRIAPIYGRLPSYHVSGDQPTAKRKRILKQFVQESKSLVTNARCLSEGVDVPEIDAVLFVDPRQSTIDIVQAVGRALRLSPGKKCGHVIIPVVVDERNPAATDEAYQQILIVLSALASQDERIIEYFRGLAQGRVPRGGRGAVQIDVPHGMRVDPQVFVESIQAKLWGRLAKLSWRPFIEAREFARSLQLTSASDWRRFANTDSRPPDIPWNPARTYADLGWLDWGDFLGTGNIRPGDIKYWPFKRARRFARSLRLKNQAEWFDYSKGKMPSLPSKPPEVPTACHAVYMNRGWVNFNDWLGTKRVYRKRAFLPFKKARAVVRKLGLKSYKEWDQYVESGRLREDIARKPQPYYRNKGWNGWRDWLGLPEYWGFARARRYAKSLELSGRQEWQEHWRNNELPEAMPPSPERFYRKTGWSGWGDFLGTGNVSGRQQHRRLWSFRKARSYVRSVGLESQSQYSAWTRDELQGVPKFPRGHIPVIPNQAYPDEWSGYGDWLGTGRLKYGERNLWPFKKARSYVQKLKLKSNHEWRLFTKDELKGMPKFPRDRIPANPNDAYKDQWVDWYDWLGKSRRRS